MKSFKYLAMIAFAAGVLVSCDETKTPDGAGDATIGFAQEVYTFKESAGLLRIPVAFTGEPKQYPITFDVVAEVDGTEFEVEDLLHFTQTEGLKYAGNEDAPAYIEFQVYDNQEINESRFVNLTITNVKGAVLAGTGKASIEIADNDNNPYERLWGNWIAKAADGSTFDVNISGGFSADEEAVNFEKTLVCWGFGGVMEDVGQYGFTPPKQPVWYLNYNAEEEYLSTKSGEVMANIWSFNGIDEDVEVKFAAGTVTADKKMSTDHDYQIKATWSKDMNTITFEKGYYLVATVWGVSGEYYGYWMAFGDVVLTRK
ncbi:MAG: hypothetical protein E7124_01700 [Bacteroidales bacterium]|nr:hypothetical protein [Bacteroidales bacterium]